MPTKIKKRELVELFQGEISDRFLSSLLCSIVEYPKDYLSSLNRARLVMVKDSNLIASLDLIIGETRNDEDSVAIFSTKKMADFLTLLLTSYNDEVRMKAIKAVNSIIKGTRYQGRRIFATDEFKEIMLSCLDDFDDEIKREALIAIYRLASKQNDLGRDLFSNDESRDAILSILESDNDELVLLSINAIRNIASCREGRKLFSTESFKVIMLPLLSSDNEDIKMKATKLISNILVKNSRGKKLLSTKKYRNALLSLSVSSNDKVQLYAMDAVMRVTLNNYSGQKLFSSEKVSEVMLPLLIADQDEVRIKAMEVVRNITKNNRHGREIFTTEAFADIVLNALIYSSDVVKEKAAEVIYNVVTENYPGQILFSTPVFRDKIMPLISYSNDQLKKRILEVVEKITSSEIREREVFAAEEFKDLMLSLVGSGNYEVEELLESILNQVDELSIESDEISCSSEESDSSVLSNRRLTTMMHRLSGELGNIGNRVGVIEEMIPQWIEKLQLSQESLRKLQEIVSISQDNDREKIGFNDLKRSFEGQQFNEVLQILRLSPQDQIDKEALIDRPHLQDYVDNVKGVLNKAFGIEPSLTSNKVPHRAGKKQRVLHGLSVIVTSIIPPAALVIEGAELVAGALGRRSREGRYSNLEKLFPGVDALTQQAFSERLSRRLALSDDDEVSCSDRKIRLRAKKVLNYILDGNLNEMIERHKLEDRERFSSDFYDSVIKKIIDVVTERTLSNSGGEISLSRSNMPSGYDSEDTGYDTGYDTEYSGVDSCLSDGDEPSGSSISAREVRVLVDDGRELDGSSRSSHVEEEQSRRRVSRSGGCCIVS